MENKDDLRVKIQVLEAKIAEQAREIERLRLNIAEYNEHERCYQSELAAMKAQAAPEAEPVMWVNPNVIGADQKINWPTAITFSNRGPCHGWTFPLYAEPQHDAELVELLEAAMKYIDSQVFYKFGEPVTKADREGQRIVDELRAKLATLSARP